MKTINIFKAGQVRPESPIDSVTIVIDETIPEGAESVGVTHTRFVNQSDRIADALFDTLPGGTIDALLGRLMSRRASLLRVPLWRAEPAEQSTHDRLWIEGEATNPPAPTLPVEFAHGHGSIWDFRGISGEPLFTLRLGAPGQSGRSVTLELDEAEQMAAAVLATVSAIRQLIAGSTS